MPDTQAQTAQKRTAATEEKLPPAVRATRSIPVPTTEQPAKGTPQPRPATVREPGPGEEAPLRPQAGRFMRAWKQALAFVFEALREAYWVLDPDSKCRSRGLKTVGRVTGTKTEEHEDPETGSISYSHYVTYKYPVDSRTLTDKKRVGSLGSLKKGAAIKVYFLPDSVQVRSAVDRYPRAL